MENHVKKYMIHSSKLNEYIKYFNNDDSLYCFDTESCFVNDEIKFIYENKLNNNYEGDVVRVYAWSLSNTSNDYVLYGEDLQSFFDSINTICYSKVKIDDKLSESKVKNIKSKMKMKLYVHNLAWDIEFLKYYLLNNGYVYFNSQVKNGKKINSVYSSKSFNIVENNNIVYSSIINLESKEVKYRKKIQKEFFTVKDEIFPSIELIDSYKIMSFKLDEIGRKVIKIDDKFNKLSDNYDYDMVRQEGYKLTLEEQMYIYNDVYILKEFLLQFYIPLETNKPTASGIAFEKFINGKYGDDKPYKQFLNDYEDLSNQPKIYNIIKKSYRGGWTQVNRKYKGTHLKNINGTSIDINSSYPSIISGHLKLHDKYDGTLLPFGNPTLHNGYVECTNKELNLLVIEFDKFYNKNDDNLIGEIQVGSINSKIFNMIGTEYIHTNVIDGRAKGTNGLSTNKRYRLYIWEFELDSILENTVFEDYEVIETLTFKANKGHFKEIVDFYTEMKIKGKKEKNNVLQNFAKLVLNSFYGKMASNYERIERKVVLENGFAKFENTDIVYEAEKRYYPAFASCVTAWARVNLRKQLYTVGYNNVLYFDTDSLYTLLSKEELENKLGNNIDSYILGKWDIEKQYTDFKAIGSKKYMLKTLDNNIICRCAGLPSEIREKETFEHFEIGATFKGKKVKTRVKGGYALIEGDYQLKEYSFIG